MQLLNTIRKRYSSFYKAERRVADLILTEPERAVSMVITELAEQSGVSEATVLRLCRKIDCEGYSQFRLKLANEIGLNKSQLSFKGAEGTDASIFGRLSEVVQNLSSQVSENQLEAAQQLINSSSLIYVVATGNTIPLAQEFAFRLSRLGKRAFADSHMEGNIKNVNLATSEDLVIGISHGGDSLSVIRMFELAKKRKTKRLLICGTPHSPLGKLADVALVGEGIVELQCNPGVSTHISEYAIIDALVFGLFCHTESGAGKDMDLMISTTKV